MIRFTRTNKNPLYEYRLIIEAQHTNLVTTATLAIEGASKENERAILRRLLERMSDLITRERAVITPEDSDY